LKSMKINPYR